MGHKVEAVRQMLSSTDTTFKRLRGRHYPSEIPPTVKNKNSRNVVLNVIQKIFAKKVDINVEIVNKSQDFAQHPFLCYTILQLIIVKNTTHILAI